MPRAGGVRRERSTRKTSKFRFRATEKKLATQFLLGKSSWTTSRASGARPRPRGKYRKYRREKGDEFFQLDFAGENFCAGVAKKTWVRRERARRRGGTDARGTTKTRARDVSATRVPGASSDRDVFSRLDGAAVGANAARSNGSRTTRLTRTRSLSREKRTSAGSGDSGAPRPRPGRRGARRVRAVATRTHPRNTSPETPPACSTSGCRGTRSRRGVPPPPRATGSSPRWRSRSIASNTTRPSRRPCGTRRG